MKAVKLAKLELMLSRKVDKTGICWPEDFVLSSEGYPIGYITQFAQGFSLKKSVFVKDLQVQKFPDWKRENLVNLCISFLENLQYLHQLNVLVGDLNPSNILVEGNGQNVFIVDTDSFQIEGFPCPVGTVEFSPPRLQNVNFTSTLRNLEDELFSVATMLFMILVPGKHPYSHRGGESTGKNIIKANFPYPLKIEENWGKKYSDRALERNMESFAR